MHQFHFLLMLFEEIFFHFEVPARHDVVQSRHSFKQGDILESPGNPLNRSVMGTHLLSMESLEMNLTLLRMVESIDHIQHGRRACTVRPDDRHDLLFFHRKTYILEGFNPPEGEADLVHFQ